MHRNARWMLAIIGGCALAAPPREVHLLQSSPRGKVDSAWAAPSRMVFIPLRDLQALEEACRESLPPEPTAPTVATISAVILSGSISGDVALVSGTYRVTVPSADRVYVPVAPRSVPIMGVGGAGVRLVEGGDVPVPADQVSGSGPWWGVQVAGPGHLSLAVQLAIPVQRSAEGGALELSVPRAGITRLALTLPPGQWDVEASPGCILTRANGSSVEVIPQGGSLGLAWRQASRAPAHPQQARELTLDATAHHLVSVGEEAVRGQVSVSLRVWTGQVQVVEIAKPEAVEVIQVSGPTVETWEQREDRVRVYLTSPVQGEERLMWEYLIPVGGPEGSVELPPMPVLGARRQFTYWAVVATTNVEVELAQHEGVQVIQPRELPESLRDQASGRVILALSGDPSVAKAVVSLARHSDVPVLAASVDRADLRTVVYPSGYQVTTCRFEVRNTTEQFLEVKLPAASQLWDVRVDQVPVRPGLVAETVLIPLASSLGRAEETTFPVEFTYVASAPKSPVGGRLWLRGPQMDIPVAKVNWEIRYPETWKPLWWTGNLERVRQMVREPRGVFTAAPKAAPEARVLAEESAEVLQRPRIPRTQKKADDRWTPGAKTPARPSRSVGKPSVQVEVPEVGSVVRFSQILQQGQAPSVSCLYLRAGLSWLVAGAVLVGVIMVGVGARWKKVVLLAVFAWPVQAVVPRQVVHVVPEDELAKLLATGAKEMAYIPYARVESLMAALAQRPPASVQGGATLDQVSLSLSVEEDDVRVVGRGTLRSRGKGWHAVRLVTQEARLARVEVSGGEPTLWPVGDEVMLLTQGEDTRKVEFEYYVIPSVQGNTRTATCPLPECGGALLTVNLPPGSGSLTVDGRKVELEHGPKGLVATVALPGQRASTLSWRYVPPELVLASPATPGTKASGQGRILAEAWSLFSVDAGVVEGRTRLVIDIVQGARDSLVFSVLPGTELLDVASSFVVDWVVARDAGRLVTLLRPGTKGRVTMYLTYAQAFPESATVVTLTEPRLEGVVRYRGQAGVQVLASLKVTPEVLVRTTRADPRELPHEVWAMATNPILLAYKHVDPGYQVSLRVDRQRDLPLLAVSVDRMQLVSVVSSSGKVVHRARMKVRNSGEQFLRATLPPGARVWSYAVAGQTCAPSQGEDGVLRLPLPSPGEAHGSPGPQEVELVWGDEARLGWVGGVVRLAGPSLEVPCSVVEWEVYLPTRYAWVVRSPMDRAPWRQPWPQEGAKPSVAPLTEALSEDQETQGPTGGWGTGMSVKVEIPMEGRRVVLSRAMLIGLTPSAVCYALPLIPSVVGLVGMMGAVALLWGLGRLRLGLPLAARVVLTVALAVAVHPAVVAAAVGGAIIRVVVRRARLKRGAWQPPEAER